MTPVRRCPLGTDKHCTLFLTPQDQITVKSYIWDTQLKLFYTHLQHSAPLVQQMQESWQLLSNLNKFKGHLDVRHYM